MIILPLINLETANDFAGLNKLGNDASIGVPTSVHTIPHSKLVLNSCHISPPQPQELHRKLIHFVNYCYYSLLTNLVDTAMQLQVNFRSLSPPPTFDMQMICQELKRLSWGQNEIEDKL